MLQEEILKAKVEHVVIHGIFSFLSYYDKHGVKIEEITTIVNEVVEDIHNIYKGQ